MAEFRDSIEIAAPPESVFEFLTTNAGMSAWMSQHADLDPTPGGRLSMQIAGYSVEGRFVTVERPDRVTFTWGFAGSTDLPPGTSTVDFRLTAIGTGTRVDLRHYDLPETELPGHAAGWANYLPRLVLAGTGMAPGPDTWDPRAS